MKPGLLALILLAFSIPELAAQVAGKIVSAQGRVEYEEPPWVPVRLNQILNEGARVRTGVRSRTAILLTDETQLKIGPNSEIQLQTVRQTEGLLQRIRTVVGGSDQSILNLGAGKAWIRSKKTPARVRVRTPAVTAAIRGTEFVIDVATDGESVLTVVDGSVDMSNEFGAIVVDSGEQGRARIGEAPTKIIIVNPEDAAQWTLYYASALSPADFPFLYDDPEEARRLLSAPVDSNLRKAQIEYDAGLLEAALVSLEGQDSSQAHQVRGWIYLGMNRFSEALGELQQANPAESRTRMGLSQAHLGLGENALAYDQVSDPGGEPLLALQKAALDLLDGEVEIARTTVEGASPGDPYFSLYQGLLATVSLVQNRKDEALVAAQQAVQVSPSSPSAHLNLSLVRQGFFDLESATQSVERALALDPQFLPAQVQQAKLLFGAGNSRRAEEIARRALETSPEDAPLQALLGFILLGQAKTGEAVVSFERAVQLDDSLGEPRLGLGIAFLRQARFEEALEELITATTLEPEISLYQSYLAKAFYEERDFERAFATLEIARELDPRDPTPHLYSGIFQEDLNRPTQAVADFEESIELNDNRAVYRSRLLLDEDRATRNVQLASAYNRLGLSDWGHSEAIKSTLSDPANSASHLFLAQTALGLPAQLGVTGSELLLARLLLPVNANSFNSFNDYTTLFERPRINATATGTYGSFDSVNGTLVASGGSRRFAFGTVWTFDQTDGFRPINDRSKSYTSSNFVKMALTPRSDFLLNFSHNQSKFGDVAQLLVSDQTDPDLGGFLRANRLEAGYHHEVSPGSHLLFVLSIRDFELTTDDGDAVFSIVLQRQCRFLNLPPPCGFVDRRNRTDFSSINFQASHLLSLKKVDLQYGIDLFDSEPRDATTLYYPSNELDPSEPPGLFVQDPVEDRRNNAFRSAFLRANYTPIPELTLIGGMSLDWANDDNPFFGPDVPMGIDDQGLGIPGQDKTIVQWNPQGGVLYTPFPSTTIRLASFRTVQPLVAGRFPGIAFARERLLPSQLGGFTLNLDEPELTRTDATHAGWDQKIWGRTFLRVSAFWRNRSIPSFEEVDPARGVIQPTSVEADFYGGRGVWNVLLAEGLTLSAGYDFSHAEDLDTTRRDHRAVASLNYVHPKGLFFRIREVYFKQNGFLSSRRLASKAYTTDLELAYELPEKRGLLSFEVRNLFDRRYQFLIDRLALNIPIPRRQAEVSLSFNF